MVMAMEVNDHSVTRSQEEEEEDCKPHTHKVGNKRPQQGDGDMKPTTKKDSSSNNKQVEWARAEMGEVREENKRLKMQLNRIMKDYQTLQMQFSSSSSSFNNNINNINVQHEQASHEPIMKLIEVVSSDDDHNHHNQKVEEPADQLVSLTLGMFHSNVEKQNKRSSHDDEIEQKKKKKDVIDNQGLSLGLECKTFETSNSSVSSKGDIALLNNNNNNNNMSSPASSVQEEAGQTWPPSKVLKTLRSDSSNNINNDTSSNSQLQNPTKKARVSVRARCDTPTMNDGCQWRKYGQKIAKGNPCPRAYYRCTVAPSCPVRKQVQRSFEDMSILITTYEGTHNHPLPIAATAMASTTSAAASMLLSGSSSSTNFPSSLNGLNFYLSDNTKSKQFYLPNSSLTPSPTCPTIILDLTTPPPGSSSSPFNRFNNFPASNYPPSISFGSSQSNPIMTTSWGAAWSNRNNMHTYGITQQQPQIKNPLNLGRQQIENIYQSYMQKNPNPSNSNQQSLPADTIAAATKAITSDPSFQSALAAALTSIIGNGNNDVGVNHMKGEHNLGQKLNLDNDQTSTFPLAAYSSFPTNGNINGCASTYSLMNKKPAASSAAATTTSIFLPPNTLPFSAPPKSASASPGDSRSDHAT